MKRSEHLSIGSAISRAGGLGLSTAQKRDLGAQVSRIASANARARARVLEAREREKRKRVRAAAERQREREERARARARTSSPKATRSSSSSSSTKPARKLYGAAAKAHRRKARASGKGKRGKRPRADPPGAWSAKDERQFQHIRDRELADGRSWEDATRIGAATVNKQRRREGRTRS